jgi:DNA-binding GntR family transcriptional regulator
MGCGADASFMLIKDLEKPYKKTLRERIYEEVVRLIVSGELPSGGWLDEKQVIDRLGVSRTPFREAIATLARGGLVDIKPYRGFYVRSFSRNETADLYELYKRLEGFAVELAVPQMSDRDIRRLESTLLEAVVALQRGDMKTYAMRDREFYEAIAEQSGNSALIEAAARLALQIQLCGTITNVSPEFAERTARGCDDVIQAFKTRDTPRAASLVRAHISYAQELILARFPNETVSR